MALHIFVIRMALKRQIRLQSRAVPHTDIWKIGSAQQTSTALCLAPCIPCNCVTPQDIQKALSQVDQEDARRGIISLTRTPGSRLHGGLRARPRRRNPRLWPQSGQTKIRSTPSAALPNRLRPGDAT